MTDDPIESFFEVSFETVLTLVFIGIILFFNKTLYAYVQVTTALIFCENIVSLFVLPVLIWLTVSDDPLSYYTMTLLILWDFSLVTYIVKKVVAINILASIALSLLYFVTTYFGAFGLGQLI